MGECTAPRHLSIRAYRETGCRCPEIVERMREQWRRNGRARYIPRERRMPDVDEVAVLRAMRGERIALNRSERREAVRQLTMRGHSTREVAKLLNIARRTVFRHKAAA